MKLKIIPNQKKQWAVELASELKPFLSGKHTIVRSGADATVCIGGDGTILYACHKGRVRGPILGIGGEKSYICQLRKDNWKEGISPLLASTKRERIMALRCTLGSRQLVAMNDAVIHASHYRVAEMDVSIDGKTISFEGDGMIISTALGSAAYAFSAGGERIGPTERKLSLVPICPYKRAFSPKVLPEDSNVVITVGSDCAFIIDGIFVRRLRRVEKVEIAKGPDIAFFEGVGRYY